MPLWTPSLALGVPTIDAQHQELFSRTDALLDAMRAGKPAEEVKALFAFLEEYCVQHFGSEERLMSALSYPETADHVGHHAHFVREFGVLKASLLAKGPSITVTLGVQQLVSGWLVKHIGSVDKRLAAWVNTPRSSARA